MGKDACPEAFCPELNRARAARTRVRRDPSCCPVPAALDYVSARGLRAGAGDLQAGQAGELGELGDRTGLPAGDQHVDAQGSRCLVGRDAAEDGDPAAGPGALCAAPQDGHRLVIGPVVQHVLQQVQVGARGQRIEEALPPERHAAGQLRGGQARLRPGDGARQVEEDPPHVRVAAQQRGQHGTGATAHVDHGADVVPPAGELDIEVGRAVAGRAHQRVEAGGDIRVRGEVLPERAAEQRGVRGLAGAHVVQQRPPRVGHPAAEAVEIQERVRGQLLRGPVGGEASRCFLGEDAL